MKLRLFVLAVTLNCFTLSFAQSPSITRKAVEHMLEEKTRNIDIEKLREWQLAHPGQKTPTTFATSFSQASERNAESVVSGDEKAESEVHAAINPTDSSNIIIAAITQDGSNPTAPLDVPVHFTTNFGQTWQTSSIDFNPNGGLFGLTAGGGDPVLAFDKSGKAHLSWLVLNIDFLASPPVTLSLYASSSANKGQTWSNPVLIDEGSIELDVLLGGGSSGSLVDKQWMAVDKTTTATEGTLYVSYTKFNIIDSVTTTADILLKKKAKTAMAFSANPVKVNTGTYALVQFSDIAVDAQGKVHVVFFAGNDENSTALYHAVSINGGTSFSQEKKISDVFMPSLVVEGSTDTLAGIAAARLYPCPHLAVSPSSGTLYATWTSKGNAIVQAPGFRVWFSRSTDAGITWSTPKPIVTPANTAVDMFYSSLFVNAQDKVIASFYDRSDAPGTTMTDYSVVYSSDGGTSFSIPAHANLVTSDFNAIGSLNGGFGIGEYTQVVAANHTIIPVWSDGRSNDGDIDIYAAFLPIDGVSGAGEVRAISDRFEVRAVNPAKNAIEMVISLKESSPVSVTVFDTKGGVIHQSLTDQNWNEGDHNYAFPTGSGVYLCRISTRFGDVVKKVVVE